MLHTLDPKAALRLLPLGVAAAFLAWLVVRGAGVAGVLVLAATATFGVLAALRFRDSVSAEDAAVARRFALGVTILLPGAAIVYFGYNAGGYFPEVAALGALVLAGVLVARAALASQPFAGLSTPLGIAAGALGLFCVWTMLSATWSDSPGRAFIETDRALLYFLTLVTFGLLGRNSRRLRLMIRGIALGVLVIAVIALVSRVAPDIWMPESNLAEDRLSHPLTYWNTLGILMSIGIVLTFHLTASTREPKPVRVLAAAALPVLSATLLLTFSRGAIGAVFIGLAAYVVLGRPRGFVSGAVAAAPLSILAVKTAYDAKSIAVDNYVDSPEALEDGHHVARVVAACVVGAAVLRFVLLQLDRRLVAFRLPDDRRRSVTTAAWGGAAVAGVLIVLAAGAPGWAADRFDGFFDRDAPDTTVGPAAERLSDPSNTGRLDQWDVAIDAFSDNPVNGNGAGTYGIDWLQHRPSDGYLVDAHSLYIEVLGELGIVGLALLLVAIASILIASAPVKRGPNRSLYAAIFAAGLVWAVHAGIDWDWEMPAVTIAFFALGGLALSRQLGTPAPRRPRGAGNVTRGAVGLAVICLAAIPSLVVASQRDLDMSVLAFDANECEAAVGRSDDARSLTPWRWEPYEVSGLCHLRNDRPGPAMAELEKAVDRDPRNWELHYALAIAQATGGVDPRPAAERTRELNPRDEAAIDLVRQFSTGDRADWRRRMLPYGQDINLAVRW